MTLSALMTPSPTSSGVVLGVDAGVVQFVGLAVGTDDPVAPPHQQRRQGEEREREGDEQDVAHGCLRSRIEFHQRGLNRGAPLSEMALTPS